MYPTGTPPDLCLVGIVLVMGADVGFIEDVLRGFGDGVGQCTQSVLLLICVWWGGGMGIWG